MRWGWWVRNRNNWFQAFPPSWWRSAMLLTQPGNVHKFQGMSAQIHRSSHCWNTQCMVFTQEVNKTIEEVQNCRNTHRVGSPNRINCTDMNRCLSRYQCLGNSLRNSQQKWTIQKQMFWHIWQEMQLAEKLKESQSLNRLRFTKTIKVCVFYKSHPRPSKKGEQSASCHFNCRPELELELVEREDVLMKSLFVPRSPSQELNLPILLNATCLKA